MVYLFSFLGLLSSVCSLLFQDWEPVLAFIERAIRSAWMKKIAHGMLTLMKIACYGCCIHIMGQEVILND